MVLPNKVMKEEMLYQVKDMTATGDTPEMIIMLITITDMAIIITGMDITTITGMTTAPGLYL